MTEIILKEVGLLTSFDKEVYQIILLSLVVSLSSTGISTFGVPWGSSLGIMIFP